MNALYSDSFVATQSRTSTSQQPMTIVSTQFRKYACLRQLTRLLGLVAAYEAVQEAEEAEHRSFAYDQGSIF